MANNLPKDERGFVRVGGPVSSSKVTLRVIGDDLDPDEVTALLGCSPTHAHRKGDVEIGRKTGYKYVKKTGIWRLQSGISEQECVEAHVRDLLAQVTDDIQVWLAITSRFSVNIFCGLFMNGSNEGFGIHPPVLRLMGERGIELQLDIYGPEFDEDLEGHLKAGKQAKDTPLN